MGQIKNIKLHIVTDIKQFNPSELIFNKLNQFIPTTTTTTTTTTTMALPTSVSCIVSSILSLILFAGMQLFKTQLGSTKLTIIVGGFLGSVLFVLILTAMNNFENLNLGRNFQAQLF